jgi:hypothetical protein
MLLSAVRAIDHDATDAPRGQQSLVHREVAQIGEQASALVVVEWFVNTIVGGVQCFQRQSRILRISGEGIGGE